MNKRNETIAVSVVLLIAFVLGFNKSGLHANVNSYLQEEPAAQTLAVETELTTEAEFPTEGILPAQEANPYQALMQQMEQKRQDEQAAPQDIHTRPEEINAQLPFGGTFSSARSNVTQDEIIRKNKYFSQLSEQMNELKRRNTEARVAAEDAQNQQAGLAMPNAPTMEDNMMFPPADFPNGQNFDPMFADPSFIDRNEMHGLPEDFDDLADALVNDLHLGR